MTLAILALAAAVTGAVERNAFAEVNRYRTGRGRLALEWDGPAAEEARRHCVDLLAKRVAAPHQGFEARVARLKQRSGATRAAENVALLSPRRAAGREVARMWIGSESHRRNLLGAFERTGIGAAEADGMVCAAQILLGGGRQ